MTVNAGKREHVVSVQASQKTLLCYKVNTTPPSSSTAPPDPGIKRTEQSERSKERRCSTAALLLLQLPLQKKSNCFVLSLYIENQFVPYQTPLGPKPAALPVLNLPERPETPPAHLMGKSKTRWVCLNGKSRAHVRIKHIASHPTPQA